MADDYGTQREREDKYDVPEGFDVPDLSKIGTVHRSTVLLRTTYFDTPDHALLAGRITLRRREGDEDQGWQLKVPSKDARTELRMPLGADDSVPERLADLVIGARGGEAVQPIAELRTERRLFRVRDGERVLVEVADDHVRASATGSALEPVEWREVEAELVSGTERQLARIGKILRAAGAEPSTSRSKLARVIGTVEPAGPAAGLMRDYLSEQWIALATGDIALRRGLDPIHRTRVGVRRIRSVLRVYGGAFAIDVAALDDELSWYQDLLGDVRDLEVLRAHFTEQVSALEPELRLGPVAADLEQQLLSDQAVARDVLGAELDSERYLALLRTVASWARHPLLRDGVDTDRLRRLAAKARRKALHRLDRGLRTGHTDELHRARRALKRSRYAEELVAPLERTKAKRIVKAHKEIQDVLGDLQDSVVAAEVLLRVGTRVGSRSGHNGFAFGVLHQREIERGERARAAAARWR